MKTNCDLIRDLLPLYTDNVCSAASRKAVENHLSKCEACKKELALLRGEFHADTQPPEESEEEVLKAATSAWKRGKHKAFLKGSIIMLTVIGLVAAIVCHCLVPVSISPKAFQTGDVYQHRVFRWNMPVFLARLLCPKPIRKDLGGIPTEGYDTMLWMHRACTVNGEKGDLAFYFDEEGLMAIEIMFQEVKGNEWSLQLLEELREYYGPETQTVPYNNAAFTEYIWELEGSYLRFAVGELGRPFLYLLEGRPSQSN